MGDILSGAGSLAEAGVKLVETPLKVSQEVREWKKHQMELSQGGVEVKLGKEGNLSLTNDQLIKQIRDDYGLSADQFAVTVRQNEGVPDSTILGFRSVASKNKLGVMVRWNYVTKTLEITALKDVTDDKGKAYKAGYEWKTTYGRFIDDVEIQTIGAATHLKQDAGLNFDVEAKLNVEIAWLDDQPTSIATLAINLACSIANKKVKKNGNQTSTFHYVIKGDRAISSSFGEQGALVSVPNMFKADGKTFDSSKVNDDTIKAMYRQAVAGNQAKLFALSKSKHAYTPVYALAAPQSLRNEASALLVIGEEHSTALRAYIESQPGKLEGSLKYLKRGFGRPKTGWEFSNVSKLKSQITREVEKAFEADWAKSTGKKITFA